MAAPLYTARPRGPLSALHQIRRRVTGRTLACGSCASTSPIHPAGNGGAMGGARWVALPAMSMPRTLHTATVLADGRVLVVGGQYVVFDGKAEYQAVVKTTASAEIYDPATETFSPTGSLAAPRYN